jgi:hypothetical protein
MPKRSNPFQHLVALIEQQLSASGSRVTESASVEDPDIGAPREIDVLVEAKLGEHLLRLGVECVDRKRPVTVEWIEQIYAKHQRLGINRTVAVAKNKFTSGALRKADRLGIKPLTLNEAESIDWRALEQLWSSVGIHALVKPFAEQITVAFPAELRAQAVTSLNFRELRICVPNILDEDLQRFVDSQLDDDPLIEQMFSDKPLSCEVETLVHLDLPLGTEVYDAAGHRFPATSLDVTARAIRGSTQTVLTKCRYGDVAVAHAAGSLFGCPWTLVATRGHGDEPKLTMEVLNQARNSGAHE